MTKFISLLAGVLLSALALGGAEAKDEAAQTNERVQTIRINGADGALPSLAHSSAAVNPPLQEGRSAHRRHHHHHHWHHRHFRLHRFHKHHHRHYAGHRHHRGRAAAEIRESGAPSGIHGMIAQHAAANGVPVALAETVVRIESRFRPHVTNGGAFGLMQIKPQTARGVGFSGPASGLLHADTNLRYGMKYLALAYRASGGNMRRAIRGYQTGVF
ncbi:MAG: hypothetical protein NVSMB26_25880 [Beijerinckiaceae bacterium]